MDQSIESFLQECKERRWLVRPYKGKRIKGREPGTLLFKVAFCEDCEDLPDPSALIPKVFRKGWRKGWQLSTLEAIMGKLGWKPRGYYPDNEGEGTMAFYGRKGRLDFMLEITHGFLAFRPRKTAGPRKRRCTASGS